MSDRIFAKYKMMGFEPKIFEWKMQAPFYSVPSIFAVFRNLVREIWFEKSGSRNLVREIWFENSG